MSSKKPKFKLGEFVQETPEAVKSLTTGLSDSVKNDLVKGGITDAWNQFFGELDSSKQHSHNGELTEGQELDLQSLEGTSQENAQSHIEAGIDYRREILHADKESAAENTAEIRGKIEEIKFELKQLINTVEMQVEFGQIVVEQTTDKPGKYHENFFIWLLAFIRTMRAKVEDSAQWLAQFQSKKKQKGYWQMFKKHGTTFGLSNERNVSTQTG